MSRIRPPPPSPSPSTLSPSRLLRYTSASLQHFLHERASQPAATHTHRLRKKQTTKPGEKKKKKEGGGGKLFLYRSGERSDSPQSSAARSLYPGRPFFLFFFPPTNWTDPLSTQKQNPSPPLSARQSAKDFISFHLYLLVFHRFSLRRHIQSGRGCCTTLSWRHRAYIHTPIQTCPVPM